MTINPGDWIIYRDTDFTGWRRYIDQVERVTNKGIYLTNGEKVSRYNVTGVIMGSPDYARMQLDEATREVEMAIDEYRTLVLRLGGI